MDKTLFLEFSKKNRENFLNILSDTKDLDIEFICKNNYQTYLHDIYNKYIKYLNDIYNNYIKENNLECSFNDIIYDFIDSMDPQCNNITFNTKVQIINHICCVEYNMIINIHKFSYELFILNHELCELDFFHGDSLTYLLNENKISVKQFREESYYDIDNFNHIDLTRDIDYLINTNMIDIYMLTILSDVCILNEYVNFFDLMYLFNSKKLLSKPLYRYLLTTEDSINAKKSHVKSILYVFFIIIFILTISIFFAIEVLTK